MNGCRFKGVLANTMLDDASKLAATNVCSLANKISVIPCNSTDSQYAIQFREG
jgi:hypothetical protein